MIHTFPKAISALWNAIAVSISYDDYHYTTGTFWADKVAAGQVDTVAECLVSVWLDIIVVPPPSSIVLEGEPAGVFEEGDKVGGEMPGISVLNSGEPSARVDVTGTKRFFSGRSWITSVVFLCHDGSAHTYDSG